MDQINTILIWHETGKSPATFNPKFVYSCQQYFNENRSLTTKQKEALQNIIDKFHINEDRDDGQRHLYGKK